MSDTREIPLSVPHLGGNEKRYVDECIETNFVSSVGPFVERFERSVAEYVGARYAVATVNGTAALHASLIVAGVEPNDEVIVSDLTFIAPVNAIRYLGAHPVLIDAEPRYLQMDADRVIHYVERRCAWVDGTLRSRETGRRVRAILPVHVLGHPVDLDPIVAIAGKYGLTVIEDATEGLGSRYKGRHVGTLGRMGCFSFNGNKILTTGGGGMIVTDDENAARTLRYLTTQAKDDPVEYVHNAIGYNYRLTNVLAAIGVAQMEQIDCFVEKKRKVRDTYARGLADIPGISLPAEAQWSSSNCWLYTIRVQEEAFGMSSRDLMHLLAARRIQSRPLWRPMHMLAPHALSSTDLGGVSELLYRDSLSIPCSVGISDDDLARVSHEVAQASRSRATAAS